jgi:hypothetical protein
VNLFSSSCQAEHKYLIRALYDYEAVAPGELTISEDEILLAFEIDEDWLLVQSQKENVGAGYVPGNYVEETTGEEPPALKIIVPPSVRSCLAICLQISFIWSRILDQLVHMLIPPTAWPRPRSPPTTLKRGQYPRWTRKARRRKAR